MGYSRDSYTCLDLSTHVKKEPNHLVTQSLNMQWCAQEVGACYTRPLYALVHNSLIGLSHHLSPICASSESPAG